MIDAEDFEVPAQPIEVHSRWAKIVSDVFSPPVIWAVMILSIALYYAESRTQGLIWGFTYVILVCILPIVYIYWMVRRGKIGDIHMKYRHERWRPFLVSIICAFIAWIALRAMNAPAVISLVAGVTLVQLAVMMVITFWWQISIHAMSVMVAVIATGMVFGTGPALVVSPLLPLVGAARLRLHRHTLAQVIAGALVGAAIPAILWMLS
jgi:hypothetical protein